MLRKDTYFVQIIPKYFFAHTLENILNFKHIKIWIFKFWNENLHPIIIGYIFQLTIVWKKQTTISTAKTQLIYIFILFSLFKCALLSRMAQKKWQVICFVEMLQMV